MSAEYMFVMMVIPSRSNSKHLIDVYLELLIGELQNLRHVGILTCDTEKRDIPNARCVDVECKHLLACGMASRWSSTGPMQCPVCMEDTRTFYLQNGR